MAIRAALPLSAAAEGERNASELRLSAWRDLLTAERLLQPGREPSADEFTVAMYGFLARTASVLIGISLADAVGDRRTQNVPGTTDEYPNWRVPLCDSEGKAVLIEDLPDFRLLRAVVTAATSGPPR